MLSRLKRHTKGGKILAGLPEITFRIWKKDFGKSINPIEDPIIKEYIRNSFIAGRAQCPSGCKTFEEDLIFLDCNSMYPFVLGSFDYPSDKASIVTDKIDLGLQGGTKMGIYTCDVDQTAVKDMTVIPYPGRIYDWNNKSLQSNVMLTSVDISVLRRYNAKVDVKAGYLFESLNGSPYRDMIKELSTSRQESTDPSDRNLLKLSMNSLSGKITQHGYLHHSAFMYSYARMWMYDVMYTRGSEYIRYTDTDSVLIKRELYNILLKSDIKNFGPVIGPVIGQFKIDVEVDKAELYNSKRYLLWNKGQIVKDHRQETLVEK